MGLNFRKSIKIAPGVRMNFGKKGTSVSFGGHGLRYTIHSSGKRTSTVGIPGSGIYYKATSGTKSHKTPAYTRRAELARIEKEQQKLEELEYAQLQVDLYENKLEQIRSIHQECDDPIIWQEIYHRPSPFQEGQRGPNTLAAQELLQAYQPGFLDRLFNRDDTKNQQLHEEIEKAKNQDAELLNSWKHMHEIASRMLNREIDAYFEVIEEFAPLDDLVEFGSGFEFGTDNPNEIHVSFDMYTQNVIPEKALSLTKTGKLSERAMTKSAYFDLCQDYMCSSALRIARDMLALLPINYVYVHAYEDRLNPATGHNEKVVILSVKYDRITMNRLNFTNLDPSDALINFRHNMNFKKTKGFEEVELILN